MRHNTFQSILKKVATLSRDLDHLGLYSSSNEIDSFLRKLAEPQGSAPAVQSIEFDPLSISVERLPIYKGAGYRAIPSIVGDRPVYIVNGSDLDKVLVEKGLGKYFTEAVNLTKKQIKEITDPAIVKYMKNTLDDIAKYPYSIYYSGSASALVPVGNGMRLVLGVSMGKDSQGRDIPLLVNSSGGNKEKFIIPREEREASYVEHKGIYGQPGSQDGYYKKNPTYVSFPIKGKGDDALPKTKNLVGLFGYQTSDGGARCLEISRSAIKDPFAGVSNPGKEALEMITQANLKAYPNNLPFGSTPPGKPIVTSVTLYSVGFVKVEIESVESDNPDVFMVSQTEKSKLEPGEKTNFSVTFINSLPYGDRKGTITVKSNSKDGDLVIPVTGTVERSPLPPRETGLVNYKMGIRKSTKIRIPIISNDNYLRLDRVKPYLARQVDSFDSLSEEKQEDLLQAISKEFEVDVPNTDTLEEKFRKARGIYD